MLHINILIAHSLGQYCTFGVFVLNPDIWVVEQVLLVSELAMILFTVFFNDMGMNQKNVHLDKSLTHLYEDYALCAFSLGQIRTVLVAV